MPAKLTQTKSRKYKLAVIGAGVMGSAILHAVLQQGVLQSEAVCVADLDSAKLASLKKKWSITTTTDPAQAMASSELILLAVKPQQVAAACTATNSKATIISILAGTRIAQLRRLTGSERIVRVMPNTPAQIGAGVSGWVATPSVRCLPLVRRLLGALGAQVQLPTESALDAVTAISGSGPAYFFAFVEALARAGQRLGLAPKVAELLARQTFFGAAKLAEHTGSDFATLRQNVTSKGGTTAAALEAFAKQKLDQVVLAAATAAARRSRELSR